MMSNLSRQTALKLKEAGLQWEPHKGDQFLYRGDDPDWPLHLCNIFVVSAERTLHEDLGGRMVFYGGGLCARNDSCIMDQTYCSCMNKSGFNPDLKVDRVSSWEKQIWLPRLDQLLTEIEHRGMEWIMFSKVEHIKYPTKTPAISTYPPTRDWMNTNDGDVPEEAAAEALLWLLEREKAGDPDEQHKNRVV